MDDVYGGEFTDDDAQGGGAADTGNDSNDSPVDGGSDMDAIYNGTAMEGSQESVDGEGCQGGKRAWKLLRQKHVNSLATNNPDDEYSQGNSGSSSFIPDRLRRIFGHPAQTASAVTNYVTRHVPFLRGESGSYVKDLSDSRISRITPETQNVKSILGNTFIEMNNTNTIRPAKQFKESKADELVSDRYIPLSNFKLYMGIEDGKLKVDSLGNFKDQTVVTPVRNKTDLTYSLMRHDAAGQVAASNKAKWWGETPHPGMTQEAVNDSIAKYESLSGTPVGFLNKDGASVPMTGMRRDKSLLVSPNGNSMFLNNLDGFNARQDSLVNAFLRKNGGAYPIQIDNGRYSHFLEGDKANYDSYMAADLYRKPETVWAFGEVE